MDAHGEHIVNALCFDATQYLALDCVLVRYWLLRCVVFKHIKGWSYRQLRASLQYRRFTRSYGKQGAPADPPTGWTGN